MKTTAFLTIALLFVAGPALAVDQFAPPDLTIAPAKTHAKKPMALPLAPSQSEWKVDDRDRPAKSFAPVAKPSCMSCKGLIIRQSAPYANINPDTFTSK
jgi:hypothetical protein